MIRIATLEDLDAVTELGKLSLINGAYGDDLKFNADRARAFAKSVITILGKVLLWEEGGQPVGLLAFLFFPHFFSGEPTAQEIMFFVRAEFRAGNPALRLLWAAEEMARNMGAKKMQFTAPAATTGVGALYERCGYKMLEVGYQKSL
jgi:GNAT superfamily N-acetyltransferase